jgi:transcriptional regulator GlxA family with amidase domain
VKQLLRTTPLPLAAIGEQTGFANVEHLSRLFKKRVGSPPSVFRATAEQERSSW